MADQKKQGQGIEQGQGRSPLASATHVESLRSGSESLHGTHGDDIDASMQQEVKPTHPPVTLTVDPKVVEQIPGSETVIALQDASGRILGHFAGCFIPAGSVMLDHPEDVELANAAFSGGALQQGGGRSLREIINHLERQ